MVLKKIWNHKYILYMHTSWVLLYSDLYYLFEASFILILMSTVPSGERLKKINTDVLRRYNNTVVRTTM